MAFEHKHFQDLIQNLHNNVDVTEFIVMSREIHVEMASTHHEVYNGKEPRWIKRVKFYARVAEDGQYTTFWVSVRSPVSDYTDGDWSIEQWIEKLTEDFQGSVDKWRDKLEFEKFRQEKNK